MGACSPVVVGKVLVDQQTGNRKLKLCKILLISSYLVFIYASFRNLHSLASEDFDPDLRRSYTCPWTPLGDFRSRACSPFSKFLATFMTKNPKFSTLKILKTKQQEFKTGTCMRQPIVVVSIQIQSSLQLIGPNDLFKPDCLVSKGGNIRVIGFYRHDIDNDPMTLIMNLSTLTPKMYFLGRRTESYRTTNKQTDKFIQKSCITPPHGREK